MKEITIHIESAAPYSQSRFHNTPRLEQESHEAYEERTWREKGHYDKDGIMYLPPMALKACIDTAVKFRKRKGPSGGASTWTKNFVSGIMFMEPILLGVHKDDVESWGGMQNADGKVGSGTRVFRIFPEVLQWKASTNVTIFDPAITEKIFTEVLEDAGRFIGVGRFRPQNRGFYGRFEIDKIEW